MERQYGRSGRISRRQEYMNGVKEERKYAVIRRLYRERTILEIPLTSGVRRKEELPYTHFARAKREHTRYDKIFISHNECIKS